MAFLVAVAKGVPSIEPQFQLKSAEMSGVSTVTGAMVKPSVLRLLLEFHPVSGFSLSSGFRTLLALYLSLWRL